ncbi:ORF42 [Helicoverpa zea single nucleopolyhedrovirus]|uniref:ORF42 n=1 Tax=Helicoverpa zea single nucleopolyhedrovirus TaxID=10468 RepID=X2FK35_9ABAC|nr:ORF42 [Helicoverpa zea single nucleopolyhedrovirus]
MNVQVKILLNVSCVTTCKIPEALLSPRVSFKLFQIISDDSGNGTHTRTTRNVYTRPARIPRSVVSRCL